MPWLVVIGLLALFPAVSAAKGGTGLVPYSSENSQDVVRNQYGYMSGGERLIHRLFEMGDEKRVDITYMPLACVDSALMFNHSDFDPAAVRSAFRWVEGALLAALTCLLRPFGGLPAAAALAALRFLGGNFMWTAETRRLNAEAPFSILLLLVAGLMAWRSRRPSLVKTVLLALAIGVSLMYRSPLAFFPFVLTAFEAATLYRGRRRAQWPHALILCVIPYLFLIPWVRFNWVANRAVVLFERSSADYNIKMAVVGRTFNSEVDPISGLPAEGDPISYLPVEERAAAVAASPDRHVLRWAAGEIAAHPLRYGRGFFDRIFWVIGLHPLLWLLAITAVCVFRREEEVRQLGLLALYFTLIHCCIAIEERFFEPLWPLLAALSGSLASHWTAKEARLPKLDEFLRRLARLSVLAALLPALALVAYVEWLLIVDARSSLSAPSMDQALGDALRLYPRDAWLLEERGTRRLQNGQWPGAAADLAAAAALRPVYPELELKVAWARALEGKNWPASSFEKTGMGSSALELVLRGVILLRQGRTSQARADFSAAHAWFSSHEQYQALYGEFLNEIEVGWLQPLPVEERARVMRELTRLDPRSTP